MITLKLWRQTPSSDVWDWSVNNGQHDVYQDWARSREEAFQNAAFWLLENMEDPRLQ